MIQITNGNERRQAGAGVGMTIFRITVANQSFRACGSHELPSVEKARQEGIRNALGMGCDEVRRGKEFFGAEVTIDCENQVVGRFIVSIGASALK
jgi:hypothetical protein